MSNLPNLSNNNEYKPQIKNRLSAITKNSARALTKGVAGALGSAAKSTGSLLAKRVLGDTLGGIVLNKLTPKKDDSASWFSKIAAELKDLTTSNEKVANTLSKIVESDKEGAIDLFTSKLEKTLKVVGVNLDDKSKSKVNDALRTNYTEAISGKKIQDVKDDIFDSVIEQIRQSTSNGKVPSDVRTKIKRMAKDFAVAAETSHEDFQEVRLPEEHKVNLIGKYKSDDKDLHALDTQPKSSEPKRINKNSALDTKNYKPVKGQSKTEEVRVLKDIDTTLKNIESQTEQANNNNEMLVERISESLTEANLEKNKRSTPEDKKSSGGILDTIKKYFPLLLGAVGGIVSLFAGFPGNLIKGIISGVGALLTSVLPGLIRGAWSAGKVGVGLVTGATAAVKNKLFKPAAAKPETKVKSLSPRDPKTGRFIKKDAIKEGEKAVAKVAGKTLGKSLLKKIPVVGALAGLVFAAQRLSEGDVTGAGLEAVSGIASTIPGPGTAASVALDAALLAKDINAGNSKAAVLEADTAAYKKSEKTNSATPPTVINNVTNNNVSSKSRDAKSNLMISRNQENTLKRIQDRMYLPARV